MSKDTKIATCLLVVIIAPFVVILSYFINGFVLSKLWEWFIVTQFGIASLSVPAAIGLTIVVGLLTHQPQPAKKNEESTLTETIVVILAQILAPFLTLFVGWIVYSIWIV